MNTISVRLPLFVALIILTGYIAAYDYAKHLLMFRSSSYNTGSSISKFMLQKVNETLLIYHKKVSLTLIESWKSRDLEKTKSEDYVC